MVLEVKVKGWVTQKPYEQSWQWLGRLAALEMWELNEEEKAGSCNNPIVKECGGGTSTAFVHKITPATALGGGEDATDKTMGWTCPFLSVPLWPPGAWKPS